jgi:IS5 family transposase
LALAPCPATRIDGHTLYEALEQAQILSNVRPEIAVVDRGYRGAEVDGIRILRSGQKRGVTRVIKAMIRRRSAIEPAIGHMKADGKLDRNWLKGTLGDALHAVLCGAGHNIRLILRKLRLLLPGFFAPYISSSSPHHFAEALGEPAEGIIQGRLIIKIE